MGYFLLITGGTSLTADEGGMQKRITLRYPQVHEVKK